MKAVILAAGRGKRMKPLTADIPKPLLDVAGKPIIQHNIDALEDYVEEFIVVTGYKADLIENYLGDRSDTRFVRQEEPVGTADAALQARELVDGKTIILNGDDVFRPDFTEIERVEAGIGVAKVEDPEKYGVVKTENRTVADISEKPENPESDDVNSGFYVVNEDFFEILKTVDKSSRGEYEITAALNDYMKDRDLEKIQIPEWYPCSYPWQLIQANESLIRRREKSIRGEVSDSAKIKGDVVIEEGAEVKEHSVIKGPAVVKSGAEIGPYAYLRPGAVIGENASVGRSEIKNSVIGRESKVPHFSYVGDSYVRERVNFGAGSKTANKRNKDENIKVSRDGKMFRTGRRKLGAFIASDAKIGADTVIKPGRTVGSRAITDANETVDENLEADSVLKNGEIK